MFGPAARFCASSNNRLLDQTLLKKAEEAFAKRTQKLAKQQGPRKTEVASITDARRGERGGVTYITKRYECTKIKNEKKSNFLLFYKALMDGYKHTMLLTCKTTIQS
jgi:hypothetical protein